LEQLINGVSIGCTYLLIAIGFNLMFGVLKIVHLAYGGIFLTAAYTGALIAGQFNANAFVIIVGAIVVAVLVGLLSYVCAIKPLGSVTDVNSRRHLSVIVSTIGFSLVIQNAALLLFGGYPRPFPHVFNGSRFTTTVWSLAAATGAAVAVGIALRYSPAGLRLRALSDNPELALCTGIRTELDKLLAVGVSSALAGFAAVLVCQQIGVVSPFVGDLYGFKALIVVIIGGLGSMTGAIVMSIVLGLTEALAVQWFSSTYRDAVAFAVLIIVLVIKYRGRRIGQLQ
jgi:branched-chain amino acid transport system permease protein